MVLLLPPSPQEVPCSATAQAPASAHLCKACSVFLEASDLAVASRMFSQSQEGQECG